MSKPYVYCRANYMTYRVVNGSRLYKVVLSDMDGPSSIIVAVGLSNEQAVDMAKGINATLDPYLVKDENKNQAPQPETR